MLILFPVRGWGGEGKMTSPAIQDISRDRHAAVFDSPAGSPSHHSAAAHGLSSPSSQLPAVNNSSPRPSSAGRTGRSLRRRFTTPPEVSPGGGGGGGGGGGPGSQNGSISSLQYYTLFPDRESAESISTDVFVTAADTLDDIQVWKFLQKKFFLGRHFFLLNFIEIICRKQE